MKASLYIGVFLLVLSSYSYSQLFDISNKYIGAHLIESETSILKIEKDCLRQENYWQLSEVEKKKSDSRCVLYKLPFDFKGLYEALNKKTIIYSDGELQLSLTKKEFEYTFNQNKYEGQELILSLVNQQNIKDSIILSSFYSNETNYASVGYQYYYLAATGDIYLLQSLETDDGISPLFWKHYWVDKNNFQFNLKKMLINRAGIQYQFIYPDQFTILSDTSPSYHSNEFALCLKDKSDSRCSLDVYIYYLNMLKQKITSLEQKKGSQVDSFLDIEKKINSICLVTQSPSHFNEIDTYINNVMSCLITQTKQSLNTIGD